MLVTPLGNTTFLGLAMVESLLGEEELTRAIAFDQLGSFLGLAVYGSFIAAHYGSSEGGVGPVALRLLRFPPFLAVLARTPLRWVEPPAGAEDVLGTLGRPVAPIDQPTLGLRFRVVATAPARPAATWLPVTDPGLLLPVLA